MRLAFDIVGPTTGLPIVLLHGVTNSRERYSRSLVPQLSARRCLVVNVDLRGHGESPRGDSYRASDYASDVAELVESEGVGPAVIVAHSMGGLVASSLTALTPEAVRALFLEDPSFHRTTDNRSDESEAQEFMEQLHGWQTNAASESEVAAAIGGWPSSSQGKTFAEAAGLDTVAAKARALLRFDTVAWEAFVGGETSAGHEPAVPADCPVTVLAADPAFGAVFLPAHAKRYTAAVPHARIVTIDGSGHSILESEIGQPRYMKALNALLDSF